MDINKFEKFESTGAKLSSNTISISRAMGFGFNAGFYHENNIANYTFINLLYNTEDRAIGFIFTNERKKGVFRITHTSNKTSASIVARSFFTNYKLDKLIEQLAGKYMPEIIDSHGECDDKAFFIKLDNKL